MQSLNVLLTIPMNIYGALAEVKAQKNRVEPRFQNPCGLEMPVLQILHYLVNYQCLSNQSPKWWREVIEGGGNYAKNIEGV